MARHRHTDARTVGRSRLVPHVAGEDASARHARRLQANLEQQAEVQLWATERGLVLEVKNGGQHWIVHRDGFRAEWWPSTAKLVVNQQWERGTHVHDWRQAMRVIERALRRAGVRR